MRSGQLSHTHSRAKHGIVGGEGIRALIAASVLIGTVLLVAFITVKAHYAAQDQLRLDRSSAMPSSQKRDGEQEHRVASILFVPWNGKTCEKRRFDNRTGRVVFNGYVDCRAELNRDDPSSTSEPRDNTVRMRAILNAFKK